jgi:hypothetical protein
MATILRKALAGLAAVAAVALGAGSGTKALGQSGCTSCCANPCCGFTQSVSAQCGNGKGCSGSISFNVCGGGYGTPYYWIQSPLYCCGLQFCSITNVDGQCGDSGANTSRPSNESPYELSAVAWPVLVLDCSGQYKLVEPELAAPWGPPKAAGAPRAEPAARNRGKQGSASRAS